MKLIISAASWDQELRAGMRQSELIAIVKDLGCVGVEFRPLWQDVDVETEEIYNLMQENKLNCTYACNAGALAETEESTMAGLNDLLLNVLLAEKLGAHILRFNVAVGKFNMDFIRAPWWQQAIHAVLVEAANRNIVLAVENGPDSQKGDLGTILEILSTVDSPTLRATFDTANWLYANTDPQVALERLLPYIGYVHLKDLIVVGETKQHSYPGSGIVDVAGIAKIIDSSGFDGCFALEFPGGNNPLNRVQLSIAYLKEKGAI